MMNHPLHASTFSSCPHSQRWYGSDSSRTGHEFGARMRVQSGRGSSPHILHHNALWELILQGRQLCQRLGLGDGVVHGRDGCQVQLHQLFKLVRLSSQKWPWIYYAETRQQQVSRVPARCHSLDPYPPKRMLACIWAPQSTKLQASKKSPSTPWLGLHTCMSVSNHTSHFDHRQLCIDRPC